MSYKKKGKQSKGEPLDWGNLAPQQPVPAQPFTQPMVQAKTTQEPSPFDHFVDNPKPQKQSGGKQVIMGNNTPKPQGNYDKEESKKEPQDNSFGSQQTKQPISNPVYKPKVVKLEEQKYSAENQQYFEKSAFQAKTNKIEQQNPPQAQKSQAQRQVIDPTQKKQSQPDLELKNKIKQAEQEAELGLRKKPDLDPALKDDFQARLKRVPELKDTGTSNAVTLLMQNVANTLKTCPIPQQSTLLSHEFGGKQIQPVIPPMTFGLTENRQSFHASFGRLNRMPPGEVLSQLLTIEDDQLDPSLLDFLFKFDIPQLKKQAACESVKMDAAQIMAPKFDKVFRGICGDTEISPVCLGLQQHNIYLEHDVLSGQLNGVKYSDMVIDEEVGCLDDEAEIEELLLQARDPFYNLEAEELSLLDAGQKFLVEFKDSVAKQLEEEQQLSQQIKAHEHEFKPENQPESDDEEVIQPQAESKIQETHSDDEVDRIVQESDAYRKALSKSGLQMTVVAKDRKDDSVPKTIEAISENKDQQWVIKDNLNMKNFHELVQDPALEYDFTLDDFQKRAIYRLEQGQSVMVAAHTSAGKTAVAEYAIALSRRHMTKTIYTSPIKSLSNQKYRDFKLKFGDVGVLTGDVQLNSKASCLIMTTEVLQSMLYNNTTQVQDVEWVIFDEVHYITDPERGSVWEEVIMKLPDTVNIIMLSATVPNYLEFANWVGRTKQKKIYVQYTDKRPVPLMHNVMLDGKMTLIKEHESPVDMNKLKPISMQRKQQKYSKENEKDSKKEKAKEGAIDLDQLQRDEKPKVIDFKAKCIKAKEGSMKKMLSKQTAMANNGGGAKGPNQGQGKKKSSSFNKTIVQIQNMKLLPCIVFAFSRAGTFELAAGLDPTVDFTDGYTKGLIRKFVKQKLQRLDEADREIPQIKTVTELLYRGIGVHHAGLLQLMKELVEILFSDGYLKVVFATSTFAIGLNLPARCVLFTQMRKFNGNEMSTISTSEYLQMAGRAGRRGKDDRGHSIICMDPDLGSIPSNGELQDLLDSKGVQLESQLKIDYKTCLNVLKQEAGEIGSLLQNSFFADEDMKIKLQSMKQKKKVEPIFEKSKDINCIHGVPEQIKTMFDLVDELWIANNKLNYNQAPALLQIVEVTTAKHILKPMIVVKVKPDSCLCVYAQKIADSWPIQYDNNNAEESIKELAKRNQPKTIAVPEIYAYEYVDVNYDFISKFYTNRITEIDKIHFISNSQINEKQLKVIIKEYSMVKVLKEREPQGKSKKNLLSIAEEQADIITKMQTTTCWNCEYLSYHLTQVDFHTGIKSEMEKINKILDGGVTDKEHEYNTRNSVLIEYKIIDAELNMLFKGKVATKANNDLILTEFFFSGLINELTDCELLALLSVFNTREKAGKGAQDCSKKYSDGFAKAIDFIYSETEKLMQMEVLKGVTGEEDSIEKRLNLQFYEMVYDWADQKSFAEASQDKGIDEGFLVKMIMSVNRIRQKLQEMATFVGDNSLAERLKDMAGLIDRGIVKMQSLYLEVEQEPPRLNNFDDVMPQVKYQESKE